MNKVLRGFALGCKHEGGTDACKRDKHRACIFKKADYDRKQIVKTGRTYFDSVGHGYTCELLAISDLNERCRTACGGFAYKNPVNQGKDDAAAKTSLGWRGVQIKAGRVLKTKSGKLRLCRQGNGRSKFITSPILALVSSDHLLVRYVALEGELPPELPAETTRILDIHGDSEWLYMSTNAESATAPLSKDESIRPDETSSSAQTVGAN